MRLMTHLTLSEWRADHDLSLGDFAAQLGLGGVNPGRTLQRYERGERPCPLDLAIRIEALTGGAVRVASFDSARRAYLDGLGTASPEEAGA